MAVSKRTRFEIFKRDKFTCQYCGRRPPDVVLEVDHIVPKVEDGDDDPPNLTTSCQACNRGKAGIPLNKVAPALGELEQLEALQEMAERRLALERQIAFTQQTKELDEKAVDTIGGWWEEALGTLESFERPSILQFLNHLNIEEDK